ncbi:MAG: hypothetical protein ACKO4S_15165 [Snowella sp.]
MIETVLLSGVSGMTTEILLSSLRKLGRKYSVDIKYVLSEKVEADFQKCLNIAIKAFLEFVSKNTNLNKAQQKMIVEYLKSSIVTEEIWHLLDPGSEIFDRGLLTQNARETLLEVFGKETETIIFDAWEEFLKAFSFASRSAPELREFLRASYEAGSFKALSNIEDVLEKMDNAVSNLKNEELIVSHAIKDYTEDLKA